MSDQSPKKTIVRRARLKRLIELYKRETGRRWSEVYEDLGLSQEQGKSIRAIGNRAEPSEGILIKAHNAFKALDFWEDGGEDNHRLAGFNLIKRHRDGDYSQEKYIGWYRGYSCSSLRPGHFAITYMNIYQDMEHIKVRRHRGGFDNSNVRISHGVSYFINEQIYVFSEDLEKPEEIVSLILRQNVHPPGQYVFGVFVALGILPGAAPHPSAGKIIYEYLGANQPKMEPNDSSRWWVHQTKCDSDTVSEYLTYFDNFHSGDFILRGRRL